MFQTQTERKKVLKDQSPTIFDINVERMVTGGEQAKLGHVRKLSITHFPIDSFDKRTNTYNLSDCPPSNFIKGSLGAHVSYWEVIGANKNFYRIIKFGYRIPFVSLLPSAIRRIRSPL